MTQTGERNVLFQPQEIYLLQLLISCFEIKMTKFIIHRWLLRKFHLVFFKPIFKTTSNGFFKNWKRGKLVQKNSAFSLTSSFPNFEQLWITTPFYSSRWCTNFELHEDSKEKYQTNFRIYELNVRIITSVNDIGYSIRYCYYVLFIRCIQRTHYVCERIIERKCVQVPYEITFTNAARVHKRELIPSA